MTDLRKSIGHALVDNLGSSPLRRRSGVVRRANAAEIEIAVNDDAAERQILRIESNGQASPAVPTSRRSVSLNLGEIKDLTGQEIEKIYSYCMKLSYQNKINTKNAFSLKLIDCMAYMVRNKSEGIKNLQVAGTTLDISAKIYSLRIDALYQEILKISGNLDSANRNNNDNEDPNGDVTMVENGEDGQNAERAKKKKKKKGSQKILSTIENFQGKVDTVDYTPIMFGDSDCQTTNMLYQASLPQHCGLGLSLNPYNDVIIDTVDKDDRNDETRIAWPPVRVDFATEQLNSIFSSFEILNWSIEQEEGEEHEPTLPSQESFTHDDDNLAFDLDASIPPEEDDNNEENFFHVDVNEDEEVEMDCHPQRRAPCVVANLQNIIERMPTDKKLEYSIFKEAVDIRWIGPTHWKVNKLANNTQKSNLEVCQQNPKKKKKDLTLRCDEEQLEEELNKKFAPAKKDSVNLKTATMKNCWSAKKLLITKDNYEEDEKKLCKQYLRPDEMLSFKNTINNDSVISDDNDPYNYDNGNDTLNYCPNVQDNDNDVNGTVSNDCQYDDASQPPAFTGSNLIEAPKLTQKIYIPFSQRAKKLDVRHLKKCIWQSLTNKQTDKENEQNESNPIIKEQKKFTDIYTQLPKMLSKNDSEELSFPIAFVALLHLANEKTLSITSEDNYGDVIIAPSIH